MLKNMSVGNSVRLDVRNISLDTMIFYPKEILGI